MSLSGVGVPGQRVDVLNGGDVAPDGRLLSVAEIQQAFRELRVRKPSEAASALGTDRPTGPARGREPAATQGADLDGGMGKRGRGPRGSGSIYRRARDRRC